MRTARAVTAWLTLFLTVALLSGCAGTKSAYQAADGLSEMAYVVGEHYYAVVREANDLDDRGLLSAQDLRNIQDIVRETRLPMVDLLNAASAYDLVQSAETEEELSNALATAAIALSRLVTAVKLAGGSAWIPDEGVFNYA